jgi:2-polyprenyl-6-methoxyphenol hydroxylase-like FAD-dependent oxidoreductase
MTKALIVGGGITGLATAAVLSRQGIDVDLIERQQQVDALVLQPHFEIMDPALIVEPAGAGLVAAAPV